MLYAVPYPCKTFPDAGWGILNDQSSLIPSAISMGVKYTSVENKTLPNDVEIFEGSGVSESYYRGDRLDSCDEK
jgi:hypothetical protein